jgi:hypothetical protein
MTTIYILDWLILKPVKIISKNDISLSPKTRVIYLDEEQKEGIGTVL